MRNQGPEQRSRGGYDDVVSRSHGAGVISVLAELYRARNHFATASCRAPSDPIGAEHCDQFGKHWLA